MKTKAEYAAACDFGFLDPLAVEKALRDYLSALRLDLPIKRIHRGWTLDDYPVLARNTDAIIADATKRCGKNHWQMPATRELFGQWYVGTSHWGAWDFSWLATYAFGARQINSDSVSAWAEPVLDAFCAGCWFICWTDETLFWVARPVLSLEQAGGRQRLHRADGPALACDAFDLFVWHGVVVPEEWIMHPEHLSAAAVLAETNVEKRRAGCEIVGWERILKELKAKTIDKDDDETIGELIEVSLPGSGKERFLRVKCGTGRGFAIPVPPETKTALEGQAWCYAVDTQVIQALEVRT